MKGIIWYYQDRQKGIDKIKKLYEDYKINGVDGEFILNTSECFIKLNNGDFWSVHSIDGHKGRRCNISLIEKLIPQGIIDVIIKPCTTLSPYTAYNYWE